MTENVEPFDGTKYGDAFAAVLNPTRPVAIDAGESDPQQRSALLGLTIEKAFAGQNLRDADSAACCISAVWLWHDFLDQSHQISQHIKSTSGSFWHAIMHRREGDFSNGKYWFRKVPEHPVYESMTAAVETLLPQEQPIALSQLTSDGEWDPFLFVDLCQQAVTVDPSLLSLCQELTRTEWQLLFDYCYQQACGA
ncbi:MAG: hypothetical protein VB862_08315 [Pirellulaceae bacterium]